MDVLKVKDQALSTLLAEFYICQACAIVDSDRGRITMGTPCSTCCKPSPGGLKYLDLPVSPIIDLIQETYQLAKAAQHEPIAPWLSEKDRQLAVVVYFATLGEVLLAHFLRERLIALQVPSAVIDRLLTDNLFAKQRLMRLFPSATGAKWDEMIRELARGSEYDYVATTQFYLEVMEVRNSVVHTGMKWVVPAGMPEECIKNISPLLNLFVALHNRLVAPVYRSQNRPYYAQVP